MEGTAHPLDAYLPTRLIAGLGGPGGSSVASPTSERSGAALFVDIRGYTDLTERLCRAGPEGVERLKRLISRAFARYIEIIYAHGGEVALFAGDALLAVWPISEDGRGAKTCDAALELAIAGADALRDASPSLGDPEDPSTAPQLRIGVGVGDFWCATIGPVEAHEFIVAGPAVLDAMRAKRDAAPGQIVARTEVARRHLDDTGIPSTSGQHRVIEPLRRVATDLSLVPGPLPAARRRQFEHLIHPAVRAAVAEREDDDAQRWLAERRRVLPLFARFDVGELHGLDSVGLAHELMIAIRNAAAATVGAGGRMLVDDNGLVFLNVFGTPHTSRGRELERAFELASVLRAASRALDVPCAVGIAGGDAFCGALGTRYRREYVTIGRPMNLAARLMTSAPDDILVDLDIVDRAEDWLIERLGPRQFKGIADPVDTARVLRRQPPATRALVGRVAEVERIEASLASDAATHGLVIVVGQAGLGKSALLERVAARARERGTRVVRGGAGVPDAAAAYSALRPLFCAALGADPHAPPRELEALVRAHLADDPDRVQLASLLNGPLGIELEESPATLGFRGQDRAEATLRLLTGVVAEALGSTDEARPLILIDDLHWIDSASMRLFAQLLRVGRGLTILASSRPTPESQQSGLLSVLPVATTINLGPLGAHDVAALLEAELGAPIDDTELLRTIVARTAGNPLMCREYALSLRERDALEAGPTGLRRRGRTDPVADLPTGVQALISSRIDRLAPLAQRALKTGAVLGRTFTLTLLALVLEDVPAVELESTLGELEAHRLLDRDGQEAWMFDHASIRDTAYDLLLYEQRARLHRRAAVVLTRRFDEVDPGETEAVRAADLVRHWDLAGDLTMTLRFADQAADDAIDAGGWREAVSLLSRCLEITAAHHDAGTRIRRIRWMRKLSEAHGQLGHNGERRQYALDALELAGVGTKGRGLGRRVRSSLQMGKLVRTYALRPGRSPAQPGATAQRDPMHVEFARAHSQAATVAYFEGDGLKLLTETLAAIEHAEAAGLPGDLVRRYAELGGALGIGGFTGLADKHIRHALELARDYDDRAALVYVNMVRALYYCGRADWDTVQSAADEGQSLAQRLQLWNDWGNIQIVRAWMHLYRGELDALRETALALDERAEKIANEQQTSWAQRALGLYHLRCGEPEVAATHLRRAMVVPQRDDTVAEMFECAGSLALALARADQPQQALTFAREAIEYARRVGAPTVHVQAIAATSLAQLVCERYVATGDDPSARADWAALEGPSLAYLKKCARTFPVAKPHLERLRARWLDIRGRSRRAAQSLANAQRLAHDLSIEL